MRDQSPQARNISKYIGVGTIRQVLSAVASVAAIAYAATLMHAEQLAQFVTVLVISQVVATWCGLPFYPAIYRALSDDRLRYRQAARQFVLALLAGAVAAGVVGWIAAEVVGNSEAALMGIFAGLLLFTNALPAYPLGIRDYRAYNAGELIYPMAFLVVVLVNEPSDGKELLLASLLAHALKLLFFGFWMVETYRQMLEGKRFSFFAANIEGAKLGLSGALQSTAFRQVFFVMPLFLGDGEEKLFHVCWPIAEKVLSGPQAANALLFGEIRRSRGRDKFGRIYVLVATLALSVAMGVVLATATVEFWVLDSSYAGAWVWMAILVVLFLIQAARILFQNTLMAKDRADYVTRDAVKVFISVSASAACAVFLGVYSVLWTIVIFLILIVSAFGSGIANRNAGV